MIDADNHSSYVAQDASITTDVVLSGFKNLFEDAKRIMEAEETFLFRVAHKPRDISKLDIFKKENYGQLQSYCELNTQSAVRYVWAITILQRRWYAEFLLRRRP